jgi:serine/threonine-protein kinase
VVGRYTIHDVIASGGLGSVHFARLTGASGFARTVVAKLLHPQFARQPEFALMLVDEACLAARIRHPNVVSTLDTIQTADELILVMDYVHGESVWKLITAAAHRNERVPLEIATSIVIDTLHGLHAAHEAADEHGHPLGIVHRDVSPQNILVGADGISRLVDFGIALAARRLQTATDALTLKGKHGYMAPEQVAGEPVTRLTDTYAAAIVYWELLTGERLFFGRTDAETIHRSLVSRVRPPSQVVPGIPDAIDAVVTRALSRDPAERYPTARAMALALEAQTPPVRLTEIGRWVERMVGDTLQERSAVLARIEREEAEARMATASSGQRRRIEEATLVTPRSHAQETPPPTLDGATEIERRDVGPAGQSGLLRRSVAVAALLLASVGGLVWMRSEQRQPASTSSNVEARSTPRAESAVAPPASPEALGLPAASITTSVQPQTPPAPSSAPARTARPKQAANPCKPPYTIDSLGREIFKPECL